MGRHNASSNSLFGAGSSHKSADLTDFRAHWAHQPQVSDGQGKACHSDRRGRRDRREGFPLALLINALCNEKQRVSVNLFSVNSRCSCLMLVHPR